MTELEYKKRATKFILTTIAGLIASPLIAALYFFSDEFKLRLGEMASRMVEEADTLQEYEDSNER